MNPPIVIAAFGTTSRTRSAYEIVNQRLKERFMDHEIHWAYTSRIVRSHLKKRHIDTATPAQVVARLADEGHRWAVVQALTMICGHEFYRLVREVQHKACRVSIGHSLLCSPEDHHAVAEVLSPVFGKDENEAVVLVGHGTDHCIWSVYPAFYGRLRGLYGNRAYGGMIEEGYPDREVIIDDIRAAGFNRARIVPFMLVAGLHFEEDLVGDDDSWKTAFERQGIETHFEPQGLVTQGSIIDIFADHIQSALDTIPETVKTQNMPSPSEDPVWNL